MNTPWYKQAIIYSLNVETFMDSNGDGTGDFQGLTKSLDYLADLGVNCIWLLPFFPAPVKTDSYDVLDHFSIDPSYGTMEDFEAFIARSGELEIKVIIDLVLHHTSDQHQWFLESKSKNSKYRDYYIWSSKVPEENKRNQKELWTFDEAAGEYYLHRFSRFEPDLNLANPDVKNELRGIIDFWLSKGVSGFRTDVAHIIIDLEQTTARKTRDLTVLNLIHDAASSGGGEIMLVAEAADLPVRLQRYYGNGDRMNVLLNLMLNQSMFLSVAREEGVAMENEIKKLPIQPGNAQWMNFIRNHDELMLDKLTTDEMNEVFHAFAPGENMRISGNGIRRRIAPMMSRKQMELFHSLVFSFPGIPMIRYGDEIGMGEDLSLEGRKSVRTAMQWNNDRNAGFSTADREQLIAPVIDSGEFGYQEINVIKQKRIPDSFLNWMKKLIRIRKKVTEIGEGIFSIINTDNPDVLVHKIAGDKNIFIAVHNLSGKDIKLNINMTLIDGKVIFADNKDNETFNEMAAYGYRWLLLPNKGKVKGS